VIGVEIFCDVIGSTDLSDEKEHARAQIRVILRAWAQECGDRLKVGKPGLDVAYCICRYRVPNSIRPPGCSVSNRTIPTPSDPAETIGSSW